MNADVKKKYKYNQYQNLMMKLKYDGIYKPGTTAKFLLSRMIEHSGKIHSEQVAEFKILPAGMNFTQWRDHLCGLGYLVHIQTNSEWRSTMYQPGEKLRKYINKEIINQNNVASTDFVVDYFEDNTKDFATLKDLDDLKREIYGVIERINEENPPVTPAKVERYLEAVR